jgi:hypothetical protein
VDPVTLLAGLAGGLAIAGVALLVLELIRAARERSADSTMAEVNSLLSERGFRIVLSPTDYSAEVRSSPWGKRAPSRNHHVWVDLARLDGTTVMRGYGSGERLADAANSARRRWQTEQERGSEPRRPETD